MGNKKYEIRVTNLESGDVFAVQCGNILFQQELGYGEGKEKQGVVQNGQSRLKILGWTGCETYNEFDSQYESKEDEAGDRYYEARRSQEGFEGEGWQSHQEAR
jgi:hypothetical protein